MQTTNTTSQVDQAIHSASLPEDRAAYRSLLAGGRAAYRSLLAVLRSANERGLGQLAGDAGGELAFRAVMQELRAAVRPVLAQLAEEMRGRARAEAAATEERLAFLRLSHTHATWWQAVERAGIEIRPSLDGWSYRVPAIADTWDGPYAASEAALAAAITALIARAAAGG